MKTTSYDISRKLAEIGFLAESDFYWHSYDKGSQMMHIADSDGKGKYPAYDLETILEALPKWIFTTHNYLIINFCNWQGGRKEDDPRAAIGYRSIDYWIDKEDDESLADTAARLLLKLVEAGIVKFSN